MFVILLLLFARYICESRNEWDLVLCFVAVDLPCFKAKKTLGGSHLDEAFIQSNLRGLWGVFPQKYIGEVYLNFVCI